MRLISDLFAPGRSSVPRGLVALIAAPTIAFLLVPLPLAFFTLGGDWGGERSTTGFLPMLPLIGIGYGVTLVISVVFGGLTWIGLRMTRRESGRAYVLAGAVGGALVSVRFGLDGARLSASLLAAVALCVLAGALVAFCFWLIAREPGTAAPSPAA